MRTLSTEEIADAEDKGLAYAGLHYPQYSFQERANIRCAYRDGYTECAGNMVPQEEYRKVVDALKKATEGLSKARQAQVPGKFHSMLTALNIDSISAITSAEAFLNEPTKP